MVISNSGPLIALGKLGFLNILGYLYEKEMTFGLRKVYAAAFLTG
jgi:hypothetical protein